MKLVVFHLLGSSAVCLVYRPLHRVGDCVCVHDHQSVYISCSASRCLCERSVASQESFLVCVEDRYQRNSRDIQSLTKQVDSYQNVEKSVLEIVDDLHSLPRVYIRVDIAASHSHICEISLQFLGHTFGERGHEDSFVQLCTFAYLLQEVVHLIFRRAHLDRWIKKSCRTHHLLHNETFRLLELIICRCCADEHSLTYDLLEFLELQRPVV